jgi:hypothetical protein
MWTLPPLWTQRTRPQGFGNLAKEREIPTASTSIIFFSLKNKKNEEHNHSDQPSTKSDHPQDRKWSHDVRRRLRDAGIRVVLIPARAPNANACAERFVRSIKEECLNRIIPIDERHFRHVITEFVEHYHRGRNHQGLANRLIAGTPVTDRTGRVRCRRRLGGRLNFYERWRDRRVGENWNITALSIWQKTLRADAPSPTVKSVFPPEEQLHAEWLMADGRQQLKTRSKRRAVADEAARRLGAQCPKCD